MDLEITRTGKRYFGIDAGIGSILLELLPEAIKRFDPKPAPAPVGKLQFSVGTRPTDSDDQPKLFISCSVCQFNEVHYVSGPVEVLRYPDKPRGPKTKRFWPVAQNISKDCGELCHCKGQVRERLPEVIAAQYVQAYKRWEGVE